MPMIATVPLVAGAVADDGTGGGGDAFGMPMSPPKVEAENRKLNTIAILSC